MRHRTLTILLTLAGMQLALKAYSQSEPDSIAVDTVRNKYLPTGIRGGVDLLSLAKSQFQDSFNGWEFQGDVDFNRYYLAVELGHWGKNLNSDSAVYANSGTYWRAGIDVNFLTKDADRDVFFLGIRYGRSVFTESMTVMRFDPIWGLLNDSFYQPNVNASWLELTTGLKVKIWKIFWLGYTGRLKFGLSTKGTTEMLPYDVPGFGRTDKETTWGFNYYLMFRLPIRKASPPPPEK
jgi:hypothetical protein